MIEAQPCAVSSSEHGEPPSTRCCGACRPLGQALSDLPGSGRGGFGPRSRGCNMRQHASGGGVLAVMLSHADSRRVMLSHAESCAHGSRAHPPSAMPWWPPFPFGGRYLAELDTVDWDTEDLRGIHHNHGATDPRVGRVVLVCCACCCAFPRSAGKT